MGSKDKYQSENWTCQTPNEFTCVSPGQPPETIQTLVLQKPLNQSGGSQTLIEVQTLIEWFGTLITKKKKNVFAHVLPESFHIPQILGLSQTNVTNVSSNPTELLANIDNTITVIRLHLRVFMVIWIQQPR